MHDSLHVNISKHKGFPFWTDNGSAAVTKYNEFVGCGGWGGEIEKPEQDSAILIDGCPLALVVAQHLR